MYFENVLQLLKILVYYSNRKIETNRKNRKKLKNKIKQTKGKEKTQKYKKNRNPKKIIRSQTKIEWPIKPDPIKTKRKIEFDRNQTQN